MKPVSVRIDAPSGSPAEVVVCLEDNGKVVSIPFTGHFAFQLHSGTLGVPDSASVCVVADGLPRDVVTAGPFELQSTEFVCDETLVVRPPAASFMLSPAEVVELDQKVAQYRLNDRLYAATTVAADKLRMQMDASIFAQLTAQCASADAITAKIDTELASLTPDADDEDVQPLVVRSTE